MGIPKQRVKTKQQFLSMLQTSFNTGRETYTHVLVGAGFSRSAGVPVASEVAGILARCKNLRRCDPNNPVNYSGLVRDFFERKFLPSEELAKLRAEPDLAGLDDVALYKSLFADAEIFPDDSVSRKHFIAELMSASQEQFHGYNFESLYLAYLFNHARTHERLKLDTILTTNFDDVIASSFFELSAPCRLLDQRNLIDKEEAVTFYPRVVYLHGRYLHYDIANTEDEIRGRARLIADFLRRLPQSSKLIVIGYSGWEDEVMNGISTMLNPRSGRRFAAGIHWCLKGGVETASPKVVELAEKFSGFTVTPEITALEVMRTLLEAAGCPENAVLQSLRSNSERKRQNFERRLIRIREVDLGYAGQVEFPGSPTDEVEPPSAVQAIEKGREAIYRVSSLSIAFTMIGSALSGNIDLDPNEKAELYRLRAALRQRYRIDMESALADYQSALNLDKEEAFQITAGMATVYSALGKIDAAMHFLGLARNQVRQGDELALATCDTIEGGIEFHRNDIEKAETLLQKAWISLGKLKDPEASIRTGAGLMFVLIFNGEEEKAMTIISEIRRKYGNNITGQYWDGAFYLAEAQIHLQRDSVSLAKEALDKAQEVAERGPNFQLLGHVAFNLAESEFRRGQPNEGEAAILAAIQYYGLAGIGYLQVRAAAWLEIYRAINRSSFDDVCRDLIARTLSHFEDKGDRAEAATCWAILAVHCMASDGFREARELVDAAVSRCCELAEAFQEEMRSMGNGLANQRNLAFVRQYVGIASLLRPAIYPEASSGTVDRGHFSEMMLSLKEGYEKFGFYSSQIEVLYVIAAAYAFKHKWVPSDLLVELEGGVPGGYSKSAVLGMCRKKGYPYFANLMRYC